MPRVLQIAMQHAVGLNGVAVISLSGDVAMQNIEHDELEHPLFLNNPNIRPSDADLQQLASLINESKKTTLLCGAGCKGAHDALVLLAGKSLSPIVHALRGKEHVQYDNPYDVGMTGLIGIASGNRAVQESDLLLMLGTDFPYKEWYPSDSKIVQIDIRPERLGRRCKLDLGLVGDVKETINALLPLLQQKKDNSFLEKCQARYKDNRKNLDSHANGEKGKLIHPEYLTKVISGQANG
jgi:pyruvate dehydrogenase (quinone)